MYRTNCLWPGVPISIYPDNPTQAPGSEFWVRVKVGDEDNPVFNLFGMAFDVEYTHKDIINITSTSDIVANCGILGVDPLVVADREDHQGMIGIGASRKTSEYGGFDGFGQFVKMKFRLDEDAPAGTHIVFRLKNIVANDANGNFIKGFIPLMGQFDVAGMTVWPGDTDNNGHVEKEDIFPIAMYWKTKGDPRPNASRRWVAQSAIPWKLRYATYADANGDGIVNAEDVLVVGLNWSKRHRNWSGSMRAPVLAPPKIDHSKYLEAYKEMYEILGPMPDTGGFGEIKRELARLIKEAEGVQDSDAEEIIEDTLLQNYPNPFNPETWIPFSLSNKAHVKIEIFNITGQLIRTLDLGVKEAGKYISRERAAYWDGLNDGGDEVASGVYFYRIVAGEFVSTKKMVVLK
jgi:hypothetical protein